MSLYSISLIHTSTKGSFCYQFKHTKCIFCLGSPIKGSFIDQAQQCTCVLQVSTCKVSETRSICMYTHWALLFSSRNNSSDGTSKSRGAIFITLINIPYSVEKEHHKSECVHEQREREREKDLMRGVISSSSPTVRKMFLVLN